MKTTYDTEAAFRIGDLFLYIQEASDGSWDFTIYDSDYKEVDGGHIGDVEMDIGQAEIEILILYNLTGPLKKISIDDLLERVEGEEQ